MAGVRLQGIDKAFSETRVLSGIDLDIADGEFVVFVGPSGCGKSTLLRIIAGLEEPTAGDVLIGGERVNHLSPADRGIAMVFQSYALYPQMSVAENMGFALKLAGVAKAEIAHAVAAAAETLGITQLLDRKPRALSGGQRQRVAIGRAIVRQPRVFLFDEPLSNLDASLRVRMRYEFAHLHKVLGTTMIYVTHDQIEAMTLADRIVVLNGGRIEQVGAPMHLYEHPATAFVGGFIGSPRMNMLGGALVRADEYAAEVKLAGGQQLRVAVDARKASAGDPVTVGLRPEHVRRDEPANRLTGAVRFVETLGGSAFAYLDLAGQADTLTCQIEGAIDPGVESLELGVAAERLYLFAEDGGAFPRTAGNPDIAAGKISLAGV
ncbi:sn-glycerol-3-phosphate ABC transporter ATP-binding protein UgpC [Sphingomonas gilva]|uniref:sn-glycerol-3-phosphate ABC transporter ATP-binding protein UgpC n=1 Tax=Sphingomonas gilva TaxID=2305907 RepID=A0A396RPJ1_9SPHN|nr:sn-glycerol-3-phosphate ABC transporter ATP-binding protein UgpC [Sphingomonas gilva]RHW18447.1 sn-glycerol-3-phosphate ABC transporter ATP-binding protein UgpC [Sphingomonas gilva]